MCRFLNRLRILRSLDQYEISRLTDWPKFRDDPPTYLSRCHVNEAKNIWKALRRREEGDP